LAFYSELLGWQKTEEMDMGEDQGVYQMFGPDKDTTLGGMMKRPAEMPVSAWTYYANVADADLAAVTIKANGGTIIHGPTEVPGGGRIVMYKDPQGTMAAVYAQKKD
jgi:predicted enzyme related to lactoylglutathione lyase